jgi:hypothetical protein
MRVRFALALVALVLAAWACAAPPPRQREDWAIAPIRYGETRYEGLRAPTVARPETAGDAGAP